MPINFGQIIRIFRQHEERSADESACGDMFSRMRSGYYFFLSGKEKKQRKNRNAVRTLLVFGPFDHSHAARFIETSAFALGLTPFEPMSAVPTLNAELEARQPTPHRERLECEAKTPPRARLTRGQDLISIH